MRFYRRRPSLGMWIGGVLILLAGKQLYFARPTLRSIFSATQARVISIEPGPTGVISLISMGSRGTDAAVQEGRVHLIGIALRPSGETWLQEHLLGEEVTLEFDKRRLDDEGRTLAYVYWRNKFLNAELLKMGLARYESYPGDSPRHAKLLKEASASAGKSAGS